MIIDLLITFLVFLSLQISDRSQPCVKNKNNACALYYRLEIRFKLEYISIQTKKLIKAE